MPSITKDCLLSGSHDPISVSIPKIALINIYLGKFPNWMPLWLKCCRTNPEIEFLVISDGVVALPSLPNNVHVIRTSLPELRQRLSDAVGFSVALNDGYKLCDFKPVYGLAFADILDRFAYWGHVDLDQLFGRISDFIPWDSIHCYKRLYHRGHMTIYSNDSVGNNLFRLPHPAISHETIFKSPGGMRFGIGFDETAGIYQLVKYNGIPQYERNEVVGDFRPRKANLSLTIQRFNSRHQAFTIENGRAFQVFEENGEIKRREFMYFHFQKRAFPAIDCSEWHNVDSWKITPRGFVPGAEEYWNIEKLDLFNQPRNSQLFSFAWRRLKDRFNYYRRR